MGSITRTLVKAINKTKVFDFPFHWKSWKWIRLFILVVSDSLIVLGSYYADFALRLDSLDLERYWERFYVTVPICVGIFISVNFFTGIYRQIWRHANIYAGLLILKSSAIAVSIFTLIYFMMGPDLHPPRSVPALLLILIACGIAAHRFGWKLWLMLNREIENSNEKLCLVYGAGYGGEFFVRHAKTTNSDYRIAGFIDDNKYLKGRLINGVPVLGSSEDIESIVSTKNIKEVVVAIPSASGTTLSEIYEKCKSLNLSVMYMSDITSTLNQNSLKLRPFKLQDLLRRKSKTFNSASVKESFSRKVVLVTGAGGSIGSELCRQIFSLNPQTLILLDSCEFNLYKITSELTSKIQSVELKSVLCSVTDFDLLENTLKKYLPDYVLHAAAYKHVPMVEENFRSGFRNNVHGTNNIVNLSAKYKVEKVLLVSTDKAVNPTSVMGATKRICERIIESASSKYSDTKFTFVRFGNVLGSSGSVIPKFVSQIEKGGPLTVTHKDVTRYFMLIEEAVSLVLEALTITNGDDFFVLDMGSPVNIYKMAEQLIRLSGLEPHTDIKIDVSGLRAGEKLFEEILLEGHEEATHQQGLFVSKISKSRQNINFATLNKIEKLPDNLFREELFSQCKRESTDTKNSLLDNNKPKQVQGTNL